MSIDFEGILNKFVNEVYGPYSLFPKGKIYKVCHRNNIRNPKPVGITLGKCTNRTSIFQDFVNRVCYFYSLFRGTHKCFDDIHSMSYMTYIRTSF